MNPSLVTQLRGIRDIASLINAGSDLPTILDRIVYAVCHHTSWSIAGIMKLNLEAGYSELVARFDPQEDPTRRLPTRWRLATSPVLKVAETATPLIIPDAHHSDEFPGYRQDAIDRDYRTVVILPLGASDETGHAMVLSVQAREVIAVTETELAFLATVAHLAGIAVEKAKHLAAGRVQAKRLERTLEINASLLERALAGGPMETITGMVETLIAEPLVFVDLMAQRITARRSPAPDMLSEAEWRRFVRLRGGRHLVELVRRASPSDFSERVEIDFAAQGLALRLPALVEPLQVDGEAVGGLVIFPRGPARDELDRLVAQEAKLALSVQLLRSHVAFHCRSDSVAELLDALFRGVAGDSSAALARAARLGIDLTRPARLVGVALLDAPGKAPAGPGAASTGAAGDGAAGEGGEHRHRALAQLAARLWPGASVARHGADFVVFLPGADATGSRRAALLARRIAGAGGGPDAWAEDAAPAVAVSPVCRGVEDYAAAWAECARTLGLARAFGKAGVLAPDAFGPFADLLAAIDGGAVQSFVGRTLGAVLSYDLKHRTELVATAQAFIDAGRRYQACAGALGIHVSTLRYRIERLRELFGIDLEDAETRFAFALALKLRGFGGARPMSAGSSGS